MTVVIKCDFNHLKKNFILALSHSVNNKFCVVMASQDEEKKSAPVKALTIYDKTYQRRRDEQHKKIKPKRSIQQHMDDMEYELEYGRGPNNARKLGHKNVKAKTKLKWSDDEDDNDDDMKLSPPLTTTDPGMFQKLYYCVCFV